MDKKLMEHIKNRRMIDMVQYDLNKVLVLYGMSVYTKICAQRIIDEVGIDYQEILVDAYSGHILFTYWGMKKCKDVLLSFLNQEQYDELEDAMRYWEEYIWAKNNYLWLLRSKTNKQLKELSIEVKTTECQETQQYLFAEMKSRKLFNRIRILVLELGCRVLAVCMYLCLIWSKRIRGNSKKPIRCLENKAQRSNRRELAVRRVFETFRKTNPLKRRGDILKKYVYYGILAYEGKQRKCLGPHKYCEEIESQYKIMTDIVEAASKLTPNEFMNIFPVNKEFDGVKYCMKDYFYTAEALKGFSMDKPIGKKIPIFFEQYYSEHVFGFWVSYTCCMSDYAVHCGEEGPINNYFKALQENKA